MSLSQTLSKPIDLNCHLVKVPLNMEGCVFKGMSFSTGKFSTRSISDLLVNIIACFSLYGASRGVPLDEIMEFNPRREASTFSDLGVLHSRGYLLRTAGVPPLYYPHPRAIAQMETDVELYRVSVGSTDGKGIATTDKRQHYIIDPVRFAYKGLLSLVGSSLSKPIQIDEVLALLQISRNLFNRVYEPYVQQGLLIFDPERDSITATVPLIDSAMKCNQNAMQFYEPANVINIADFLAPQTPLKMPPRPSSTGKSRYLAFRPTDPIIHSLRGFNDSGPAREIKLRILWPFIPKAWSTFDEIVKQIQTKHPTCSRRDISHTLTHLVRLGFAKSRSSGASIYEYCRK